MPKGASPGEVLDVSVMMGTVDNILQMVSPPFYPPFLPTPEMMPVEQSENAKPPPRKDPFNEMEALALKWFAEGQISYTRLRR